MKKRKKGNDDNMPIGKLTEIKDFLPPPGEIAIPDETVKVTISLNRASIEFFKRAAAKHGTKYQRMIREVLDRYVSYYEAA